MVIEKVAAKPKMHFPLQPRTWTAEEMVFINSARCPKTIPEADFKEWMVLHLPVKEDEKLAARVAPFKDYMALNKWTEVNLHLPFGDIVMEDSPTELMTHFNFWKAAHGSVLISGLGLGCIVRAVAAKPEVTDVTVLEIEPFVIRHIGPEFAGNQKVTILEQDALTWKTDRIFDCAWHDIYTEEGNGKALAMLHTEIMVKMEKNVREQGAWNYPLQVAEKAGFKWGIEWRGREKQ